MHLAATPPEPKTVRIKIRKGLDLPIVGVPEQRIVDARPVQSVALVATDYVGLKPELAVAVGDHVRLGQPLFFDKRDRRIRFTAPGSGKITAIHRGARRALQSVVIELDGSDEETFQAHDSSTIASLDRAIVQDLLLQSGLWTALRTRPFSKIPMPDTTPHAIFVTAIDTRPLAADPRVVIAERPQEFADGVAALSRLTDGRVHVCHSGGEPLRLPSIDSVSGTAFDGPHPAGLPGTHIHFLDPVHEGKSVWHINYQDVIAIGSLLTTGRISAERVVALSGPAVREPRLVRTRFGASTVDLLSDELEEGECRVISGSILSGRRAAGWAQYLGPYHLQVSVLREGRDRDFLGWMAPGFGTYSAIRAFASAVRFGHKFALTTSQHGRPRAMVPIGNFERVMPLDLLPVPLLKALLVRDTDAARDLGCLELDEEDLALCSFVCCSKYEYGPVLRDNLELIEKHG